MPGVIRHLEDRNGDGHTENWGQFAQPVQEHGGILAANNAVLTKWGQ